MPTRSSQSSMRQVTALIYSTFLGGTNGDFASHIAVDSKGRAYVAGETSSIDFPVANAFQPVYAGGGDGILVKISDSTPVTPSPITIAPSRIAFQYVQGGSLPAPQSVNAAGPSFTAIPSDPWLAVTSGTSALSISVMPSGLAPGTYAGTVRLTPPAGTPASVDVSLQVLASAPIITAVDPPVVATGSDDTRITVHGSGFTKASWCRERTRSI